ncbi:hypothetical protein F5Y16DRAFT_403070 [Xylariaceae sp. FL0255]|nr:hypothetical protein F5Y16DRAFT_403070 [Xylariaceae sp. FL0255]
MCIKVYIRYEDSGCENHDVYQNTFICHLVRGYTSRDDPRLLAQATDFIPTRRPQIPTDPECSKVRKAIRPVNGKCLKCQRVEHQTKKSPTVTRLAQSFSASSIQSSTRELVTPSPNTRALTTRMKEAFLSVSKKQRGTPTPRSASSSRERGDSEESPLANRG